MQDCRLVTDIYRCRLTTGTIGDHLAYLNSQNIVVESPFLMLGGAFIAVISALCLGVVIIMKIRLWLK